jgi:DNA-binding FadR family transcriptional regulator
MVEGKALEFKEIHTGRLADLVTEQLKEAIFQGQYQQGERLPSEQKLIKIFGVSRIVIREAIRNLEQSGLVEIKRGPTGGAFLQPMRHHSVSHVIRDVLRLGKANASHIMEVRLDIEPIVAAMAAERRGKEDLETISEYFKRVPEPHGGKEYAAWNVDFHRLVARACGNPVYEILVNILMDFVEELLLRIKPMDLVVHDTISHPAIFDKIRLGDAYGAKHLFRKHLEDIVPILVELERKLPKRLLS